MKKLVLAALLSASLVLAGVPAQAGRHFHYGHGGGHTYYGHAYYGHGGYKHHYGHYHGDDLLIAAGIIGGVILLGWLLAPRPYYQPRVHYYQPPPDSFAPATRPTCYRDRVYRYLPDGRIQWGTRTTCY
jgi:hypothetical protein